MYGMEGTRCFVKVAKDVDHLNHLANARVASAQEVVDSVINSMESWATKVQA